MGRDTLRKYFLLIVVIAAVIVSSCQSPSGVSTMPSTSENNLPVINADNEHLQIERSDGTEPPEYEISAGNGFVLDTSGYEIQIPHNLNITQPNMIQIVLDNEKMYFVNWEIGKTSYTFTAETLMPIQNSKPFGGLQSGQKVIIAIGFMDEQGKFTGQIAFYPLWYAIVNIK